MAEHDVRPMSDWGFRAMALTYKLIDIFSGADKKMARLPLEPGITVVDYACGPGRYALEIARRVGPAGRVYAVDIQPLAISMVRDKAKHAGLTNLEPVLVKAYDTDLPDGCADLVCLLDAFHDIRDRQALLREIRRLVKDTGTFILEPG
ncbi:MAG: class I SAM-dependent methyltransferase, partial [candidate division WOR-3 bacterium]